MAQILIGELPDSLVKQLEARAAQRPSLEAGRPRILMWRLPRSEARSSRAIAMRAAGARPARWGCCARTRSTSSIACHLASAGGPVSKRR